MGPAPALDDIAVSVDGRRLPSGALTADGDGVTYRLAGIDADGGLLAVDLAGADSLALDNRARLRLPDQRRIRVQLSDSLPEVMAAVLAADGAIELVTERPDVVVRAKGESLGGQVPALEFIAAKSQPEAFVLGYPEGRSDGDSAESMLTEAVRRIGLDNIDITGLAQAAQRPIELAVSAQPQWNFTVWQELLSDDYNFVQSRSFPLFVAHSVRWLAGVERWYPYMAASRPLPAALTGAERHFVGGNGKRIDTLGDHFIPGRAGEQRHTGRGEALAVSLLDRAVTTGDAERTLNAGLGVSAVGVAGDSLSWLLLLALAGLLVEWWLYQKGRMP